MNNYFEGCVTLTEGQKVYRKLLMELYPDHGGSNEETRNLIQEFGIFLKRAIRLQAEEITGVAQKDRLHSENWYEVLRAVMEMNLVVEVVGDWIWCFEVSPIFALSLLMLGFDNSKKHKGWYYADSRQYKQNPSARVPNYVKRGKYTTDELRELWGSDKKRDKQFFD